MNSANRLLIFGFLCMFIGIMIFLLWDVVSLGDYEIMGTNILEWCRKTLGRNGCAGFYFFAGLIVVLRIWLAKRAEKQRAN